MAVTPLCDTAHRSPIRTEQDLLGDFAVPAESQPNNVIVFPHR
ncbi:hypothetical protein [Neorhizobium alkalisoli]|nr:hypothetical protein [Neorhizobium alkalisoli]